MKEAIYFFLNTAYYSNVLTILKANYVNFISTVIRTATMDLILKLFLSFLK